MHNNCPAKGKKREKINSSKYKPTFSVNKIGSNTRVRTCAHMHRGQLTINKQLGSTDTDVDDWTWTCVWVRYGDTIFFEKLEHNMAGICILINY